MSSSATFSDLFREAEETVEYLTETAILEFTEDMVKAMEEQDVSRSELARRMGSSPAHVTQILRGTTNFTLKSMVKIGLALEMKVEVRLSRRKESPKTAHPPRRTVSGSS